MKPTSEPDGWTIEQTNAKRTEAIEAFGFAERQAGFLLHVLLHSGVFVERQYCHFAGIVHGQKSTNFITRLVERRFATPITTGKLHRGRMFHVHYKPLWTSIGEPDNRFRKPAAQGRMIERVMLLDAVLDNRDFTCDPGARSTHGPAPVRRGRSRHGSQYLCRCQGRCP
jgi:hypothetical protein